MKKNIFIFFVFTLFCLLLLMVCKENKTFEVDGVKYAVSIDGEITNSFPLKGSYEVDMNCSGAFGVWNYEEWVAEIFDISKSVSCTISFNTKTTRYLNEYILSLAGTTQGTGEVVNENGYRYEGKNPNNYIKFNNEIWRIIGVFDSNSHGIADTNLAKIIRNDSIGAYVWNGSHNSNVNSNNWPDADLYNLLNNYYYNATDGTGSYYCYQYNTTNAGTTVPGNCDYSLIGIQSTYRNMVKSVTWYLGGVKNISTVQDFYDSERSDSVWSLSSDITTNGYVGLIYPSDYGYSVLSSNCVRTTNLGSYGSQDCAGNSWLNKYAKEWTITHNIFYNDAAVFYLNDGIIGNVDTYYGYATRPVLYLDSSVYILSGDGSQSNPYTIAQ